MNVNSVAQFAGAKQSVVLGCANHLRLSSSANPIMVRVNNFEFVNNRQQKLAGVEVLPDAPVATLIFHHGVGEHTGRYLPVFEHLAKGGLAVYSFDVHGHGKSDPSSADGKCYIHSFQHLLDDVDSFLTALKSRGAPLDPSSTFIAGQSMGGLVAAQAARHHPERFAGLIVHSGAIGVVWTLTLRIQAAMGNLLAALIPHNPMVPVVEPKNLHPDPAVVAAYEQDPLVWHGMLRVRTANELLKGMKDLHAHAASIKTPLLMVHGTKDAVTSPDAAKAFTKSVGSTDVTLNMVEGGYHEMLMGEERTGSADAMLAWVKGHLKPSKL